MALVIKNGKSTQTLTFGYLCLRRLSEKWNLPGVQSVINRVLSNFTLFVDEKGNPKKDIEDIPISLIDDFIDIIEASTGEDNIGGMHYGDWLFANMGDFGKLLLEFVQSLPKSETEKKKPAPTK